MFTRSVLFNFELILFFQTVLSLFEPFCLFSLFSASADYNTVSFLCTIRCRSLCICRNNSPCNSLIFLQRRVYLCEIFTEMTITKIATQDQLEPFPSFRSHLKPPGNARRFTLLIYRFTSFLSANQLFTDLILILRKILGHCKRLLDIKVDIRAALISDDAVGLTFHQELNGLGTHDGRVYSVLTGR